MSFDEVNTADRPTRPGVADGPATASCSGLVCPGDVLDHYRIVAKLGSGGMGEVFKAVHTNMNRLVALKVIVPHRLQDSRALSRFQREVHNAARLSHPNIVTAYDAAQDRGLWFLVMEYVEGTDLAHAIAAYSSPPLPVACEIIRQAALGLQHAHEKGMVHRDLKPANMMVSRPPPAPDAPTAPPGWPVNPLVKVLDFGLARLQYSDAATPEPDRPLTREGTVIGTPEFMSPEQATDSRSVDIRSDIYSLGCTLYYLLAGRPPFVKSTVLEVLFCQKNDPPPPLQEVRPDVNPALAAVVNRMLAKRPEERFQTPKDVARALKPWSQSSVAQHSTSETVSLAPQGVASPYRDTPRTGLSIPTLTDTRRSDTVLWILGGMMMAVAVLCFALFVFRSHLLRLTGSDNPTPEKVITEPAKRPQKEVPRPPTD
jgi:serine/threonine protein kinase